MQKATLLIISLLFLICHLSAQTPGFNSGEIINQGLKANGEGNYKNAINLYLKVPRNDTNYARALFELSFSYSADSNYIAALQVCETGLNLPESTEYELDFLNNYAGAIIMNGDSIRALRVYDSALLKYPASQALLLNKALLLYRSNKINEAEKIYQGLLTVNPFLGIAHFRLGLCAAKQGRMIPSMMSLFTYLIVSPNGSFRESAISQLSIFSKTSDDIIKMVADRKVPELSEYTAIEEIILSGVALDRKYKLVASLDDPIVRQLQVMCEKLNYSPGEVDFSMQYYVPFLKSIFEKKKFEEAAFYAFSYVELEVIKKYLKKNKSEINDFTEFAVRHLAQIGSTRVLNYEKRMGAEEIYHTVDGVPTSKGKIVKDNGVGSWEFYHSNGNLKAMGSFNEKGEKTGEWKYYFKDGVLNAIENWKSGVRDGESLTYNSIGVLIEKAHYKEDKLNGEKIFYFRTGNTSRIANYAADKLQGNFTSFYSTGRKRVEANYADNMLSGAYKSYHENGQPEIVCSYSNGEIQGLYKSYHPNGELSFEGNYDAGKANGELKNYYSDKQLKRVRTFEKDLQTGSDTEYNTEGIMISKIQYENGKANGIAEYYGNDGKLYSHLGFKNDALVSSKYFDKSGKEISSSQLKGKTLTMDTYNANGIKISNNTFGDKGQKVNNTTFYFPDGNIREVNNYKNGQMEGAAISYYRNGKKAKEISYKEGTKNGYYKAYYMNGQLSVDGWYQDNVKTDTWIYYNEKGMVTDREFYVDGDLSGYSERNWENGKLKEEEIYKNGWMIGINQFDTSGKLLTSFRFNRGTGKYKRIFSDGKIKSEGDYVQGEWQGPFKAYHPDGSLRFIKHFNRGLIDSTYKELFTGGGVSVQGQYLLGNTTGTWKYYEKDGKLSSEKTFKDDEPNGIERVYFPSGKTESELVYKNGVRQKLTRYSEDGQLNYVIYYDDDVISGYTYNDKNGKLLPTISLPGGNGKMISYFANGNKSFETVYIDGKSNGSFRMYHPNGKVYYETNDEDGISNGKMVEYFPDGKLTYEYNCYLDHRDGPYKVYHPNGKVKEEGQYYNGYLNGPQKFYDVNGKVIETCYYYYGDMLAFKKM